jgi:hypothetical protein
MSSLSAFLGMDARGNANKVQAQQQALLQYQADLAKQISGSVNPMQSGVLGQLYANATNPDLYGGSYTSPRYAAYEDATAPAYDHAVNQTFADFASRGLGGDSSGLDAQVSQTRRSEASDLANYRRNLLVQGQQAQQQNLQSLQGDLTGQQQLGLGALSGAASGLGGLAGMYNSQADSAIKNITGLATTAAGIASGNPAVAANGLSSMGNTTPVWKGGDTIPMAADVTGGYGAGGGFGAPSWTDNASSYDSLGGLTSPSTRGESAGDNTLGTNQSPSPVPMMGGTGGGAGTGSSAYNVFGIAPNKAPTRGYAGWRGY